MHCNAAINGRSSPGSLKGSERHRDWHIFPTTQEAALSVAPFDQDACVMAYLARSQVLSV